MRRWLFSIVVLAMLAGACGGGDGTGVQDETSSTETTTDESTVTTSQPSAETWEPVYEDGVLQPVPDGFPEDAITLLNVDEPGSDDGVYIRVLQDALDGIAPVPVNVQDRESPTFGSWAGLEYISTQRGGDDGYIAMVAAMTGGALDILVEPIEEDLGLTIDDWNPVIVTEKVPFVVATRKDAPWGTSYEEMAAYALDHPGELRYAARLGSQLDISMERLMAYGEWTAEKIPLSGLGDVATAVGAGEADFAMLLPGTALSHWEAGRLDVILTIGDSSPAPWEDAATTVDIGLPDEPWGTLRGFLVSPSTPELHRQWLLELFRAATETDAYQQRLATVPGAQGVVMDHDEVMIAVTNTLEFAGPIMEQLGIGKDS